MNNTALEQDGQSLERSSSKRHAVYYVITLIIVRALSLTVPHYTELLIDSVSGAEGESEFFTRCGQVLLINLLFIFFLALSYYIKTCYEGAVLAKMKLQFAKKLSSMKLNLLQSKGSGYFLQRFIADIDALQSFIIEKPANFVIYIFYTIGVVALMLNIDVYYAILLLVFFPVFVLFSLLLAKKIAKITEYIEKCSEKANSGVSEIISCIYSIKANNAEEWSTERTRKHIADEYRGVRKQAKIEGCYDYLLITGIMNIVSVLVYIVGGYLLLIDRISYGKIIAMSLYYSKLWTPLEFFLDYPKLRRRYLVRRNRVDEVLNIPDEKQVQRQCGRLAGLEVSGLCYSTNSKDIFTGAHFEIASGEKVGIMGENGTGKTTLAGILTGLVGGYTGKLRYNGVDYEELSSRDIREHIGLIPAQPELFSGSIKDNVLLGAREIPEAVTRLLGSKGLTPETEVLERGSNFSSGEGKIIELCRGFCRNCDMYIIDEPLNFIDEEAVEMVIDAIAELFADKMLIIISHDRRAFRICDRIMTLSDGKIE